MSVVTEIERIQASNERIKSNIANAYSKAEEKGVILPDVKNSANLASTIESIDTDKWQPRTDWWDIDGILKNDTETYPAKMIYLLNDYSDSTSFVLNDKNNIAKVKTSDGVEYEESAVHFWDKTQDKECGLGYRTRYVIVYFSELNSEFTCNPTVNIQEIDTNVIYVIFKDLQLTYNQTGSNSFFRQAHYFLECAMFDNSCFTQSNQGYIFNNCKSLVKTNLSFKNATAGYYRFMYCSSLREFVDFDISNYRSIGYMFAGCEAIRKINKFLISTPATTTTVKLFEKCHNLESIEELDLLGLKDTTSIFSECFNLSYIGKVSNILISGLNFASCYNLSHDTLIKILEALADYSQDNDNTYVLTFGSVNLTKLTDEEIAIGQNKGWTIS